MSIKFGTAGIADIKFGNNQIVKVYQGNDLIWPTMVGDAWTNVTSLQTAVSKNRVKAIAWSGTQFCAGADNMKCATSPDGKNWTRQDGLYSLVGSGWNITSIAWSPELSMFCTVAAKVWYSEIPPESRCFTSSDGVTWSEQVSFHASFGDVDMQSVAWSGTRFCAVGWEGRCGTSSDGVTWTNQPNLKTELVKQFSSALQMKSIAWDGSKFCAIGLSSGCATSPDGVTWTGRPDLASTTNSEQMNSIVWSSGRSIFCAVGNNGACATSPDGVTWKSSPSLSSVLSRTSMWAVTTTGNSFCTVGNNAKCATSPDGVTWTYQKAFYDALILENPGANKPVMWAIAWSNKSLCAVGERGRCATAP